MQTKKYQPSSFKHYIMWGLCIALYAPIFSGLYRQKWESLDYTHAYFILPIALFLAWQKRSALLEMAKAAPETYSLSGFFFLMTGAILFIFGWRQEYFVISTFSLIPFLFGVVMYIYGMQVTRALLFPILYLLLLVPPPLGILDSITLPMRYGISILTEQILVVFQYPVTREGLLLTVDTNEIFMGAPCSGFRSLITLFSLALLYIYSFKSQLKKQIILLILVVPFALLGNLIRVLSLCLVTYHFGAEKADGAFHDISGLIMFVVMIVGLIGVELFLEKSHILGRKK